MLAALLGLAALLAAAAPFLGRYAGRPGGWPLAAGLLALALWVGLTPPPDGTSWYLPWIPSLDVGLRLRFDGLSWVFLLLVLGVGAAVLAYSARYLKRGPHPGFYGLMTAFAAAMTGLVLADDVILLFVMWEFTTVCSFFLIARTSPQAQAPAVRTFLVTVGGGLCLLGAVVAASVRTGTTQLSVILEDPVWSQDPAFAAVIAVLVAVAAFTKSAQFPFHAWLPDAMVAPTPVSAYLHAAAMVKAGIYLLLRFSPAMSDVLTWNVLLITVGLITTVMGAVFALQRNDLKELLAYSTVSQLGLIVATIGVGTSAAIAAATLHTMAHALFKSAAFMLVGVIDHQAGTRDIRTLAGVGKAMPWTAAMLVLASASMAGLPPLLGFVSKESILDAMVEGPGAGWLVAGITALGAVFTFAYCARMVLRPLPGTRPASLSGMSEGSFWLVLPAAAPAALGLLLGPAAWTLDALTSAGATAASGSEVHTHLTLWHGLTPALFLSLAVYALGALVVWRAAAVERALDRRLFPFTGVEAVAAWQRGTVAVGARVGDLTRTDAPARHLAVPIVGIGVLAAVGAVGVTGPGELRDTSRPLDWVLLGLVAIGTIAAATLRSRIGALAVIGVTGFAVTLLFFTLGAADVALTQLLVEILTVVVAVLLLRRLPRRFRRVPRSRAAVTGAVAVVGGLAAAVGTYALTGRRDLSAAGEYFLLNAPDDTGGTNVVNTILVDYRALDTLGELTVLGIAGVVVYVLLESARALPLTYRDPTPVLRVPTTSPLIDAETNGVFNRTFAKVGIPLMLAFSVYLLLRGHQNPGGGFIGALVAASAFALAYLAAASDTQRRASYFRLIGAGILIATGTGLLGLVEGSFLKPLHVDIGSLHLTSAVLFDVGVYLAVIGVVVASLDLLGGWPGPRKPTGGPGADAPDPPPDPPRTASAPHREHVTTGAPTQEDS
jgi:multicomponent Na+:H+ antiporter subunit A